MSDKRGYDLQERLIAYAVRVVKLVGTLPKTEAGRHIAGQLLRSGTSPAANYAESQSAESRPDFVHKLKIALKELRESGVWLQIIIRSELLASPDRLTPLLEETDALCAILQKALKPPGVTAKRTSKRTFNSQHPTSNFQAREKLPFKRHEQ